MAQMDNLVNRVAAYLKMDAADIMHAVEREGEVIVITNDMRKYRLPAAELPSSGAAAVIREGEVIVITNDMRKYRIPAAELPSSSAATVSDDRPPSKARSKPGR